MIKIFNNRIIKVMFTISMVIMFISLISCNTNTGVKFTRYLATDYDFNQHVGKTIDNIKYLDNGAPSGDYLILSFTDSTKMLLYAYKYDMKMFIDIPATKFNFKPYHNIKVISIEYIKNYRSGNLLTMELSDNHNLVVYNYKYTMEIHKY